MRYRRGLRAWCSNKASRKRGERLTPAINKVVDIPFLTERMEAKLIGFVVGVIVNAMVKGFRLEESPS